ncbi:MAG: class I SAM-dependent methyltransferase [Pseudonocardiaceae bacterium]
MEVPVSTTTDEAGGAAARPPRDTERFFDDNELVGLYNRFARSLDAPELPMNRWLYGHLGSGRRALDVGCGVGRHTAKLADRYDDVVGVDVAPAMIEVAERDRLRPNIRYQVRDVLGMTPEHDGRFDLVLAFSCVLHVGPPELVFGHLRRLVAKGGTLLAVEVMWEPGWGSRDWQADVAFGMARVVWETVGDLDDVAAALQLILSPTWLEVTQDTSVPSTREDFRRECSAALPGVTIEEIEVPGSGAFAVSWRAEDE